MLTPTDFAFPSMRILGDPPLSSRSDDLLLVVVLVGF